MFILLASPAQPAEDRCLEHGAAPAALLGVVRVENKVVMTVHPVAER